MPHELADGVYAALKEEDETLRLDAIDLAKDYFTAENIQNTSEAGYRG